MKGGDIAVGLDTAGTVQVGTVVGQFGTVPDLIRLAGVPIGVPAREAMKATDLYSLVESQHKTISQQEQEIFRLTHADVAPQVQQQGLPGQGTTLEAAPAAATVTASPAPAVAGTIGDSPMGQTSDPPAGQAS